MIDAVCIDDDNTTQVECDKVLLRFIYLAIGVATVEGDWEDKEVEAGGTLVLRLQGICQLAYWSETLHREKAKKEISPRSSFFPSSLSDSDLSACCLASCNC